MDQRERLGNLEESLRTLVEARIASVWTAFPGIVTKVNLEQMTVQVQPAIQESLRFQTPPDPDHPYYWQALPILQDVPILFLCNSKFALTLPISEGDEVLVIITSRCIDAWWQQGGVQVQAELRMHDLSDGFAIPGPCSLPNVLPSINPNTAQLRTKDGTAYIEITATGAVNIVAPGGFNVNGDAVVTGTVEASGEGTFNSIPVSSHVHPGVQSGGSDTGAPIP